MAEVSSSLATQYLRLAIWQPQERSLTKLALALASCAGTSCSSILEAMWPSLRLRLDHHHAHAFAQNLAACGEHAALGLLLQRSWQHLSWQLWLKLLVTTRRKQKAQPTAGGDSVTEQMVKCLCRSSSTAVRSAIEITLQEFALESAPSLVSQFPQVDLDARVRIVRLLAPLAGDRKPLDGSISPTGRDELRQVMLAAAQDACAEVRAATADALRQWRGEAACGPLFNLLFDDSLDVAASAFDSIVGITLRGAPEADAFAVGMLQLEVPAERGAPLPDQVDLLLQALRASEKADLVRHTLDQGLISSSLRPHVARSLEEWSLLSLPQSAP